VSIINCAKVNIEVEDLKTLLTRERKNMVRILLLLLLLLLLLFITEMDTLTVSSVVGQREGAGVGLMVGRGVGSCDGTGVGCNVGLEVGSGVGTMVGC
jgi:hypothetical protein